MRPLSVILLAIFLTACGFQLRGSFDIDPQLQPIYVDAPGDLRRYIFRSFDFAGVERTGDRDAAATILRVNSWNIDREVLSLDLTGRANEFELIGLARWQLDARVVDEEGEEERLVQRSLISETEVDARRTYQRDPEDVLGRDEIEDRLRDGLRADVTDQILFRLQAWRPE